MFDLILLHAINWNTDLDKGNEKKKQEKEDEMEQAPWCLKPTFLSMQNDVANLFFYSFSFHFPCESVHIDLYVWQTFTWIMTIVLASNPSPSPPPTTISAHSEIYSNGTYIYMYLTSSIFAKALYSISDHCANICGFAKLFIFLTFGFRTFSARETSK